MWHVGIDLHRATVVMAAVSDAGETMKPISLPCEDTTAIVETARKLGTFRAVIEASGCYRWLYDLLRPHGTILLGKQRGYHWGKQRGYHWGKQRGYHWGKQRGHH